MRCIMCGMEKGDGDIWDVLECGDPLCHHCRNGLQKVHFHMKFRGVDLYADYLYDDAFANLLIQFKECFDEALKDVFIYPQRYRLWLFFMRYTVCYIPSAKEKVAKRGFDHLEEMFSMLPLPKKQLFEKILPYDQKNKDITARKKMTKNMRLIDGVTVPKRILLVDDTMTTGASLEGALRCLEGYRCKICIYVVSINKVWVAER